MEIKKAVVCDDDKTMGLIVERVLSKMGFSVSTAGDGEEGLALVRAEKPRLLLLDIDMPVKDGLTVLADLGKEGLTRTYIVMLSAHESKETHERARLLGAGDFMIKPFTPADLIKKIEGLVGAGKV